MPHRAAHLAATTVLVLIFGLFAQAVLGLPYEPRFNNAAANYWTVAALSTLTPVLVFFVARTIRRPWLRRTGLFVAAALMLPCLLISSCAALDAPWMTEPDLAYELLSDARGGPFAYRLYRTSCGATCAYGLELREEVDLPFGAKLVSPLWSMYRASEGTVKVENSSVLVVRGDDVLGRVRR